MDRDFFKDFQSDNSWQLMLIFIFKHNRIVFHKEDFKEYYEEQKAEEKNPIEEESKLDKSSRFDKSSKVAGDFPEEHKIEIIEDFKECKH